MSDGSTNGIAPDDDDTLAGGEFDEQLGAATADLDGPTDSDRTDDVHESDDPHAGSLDESRDLAEQREAFTDEQDDREDEYGTPRPPTDIQPDSQGRDPLIADLGEDGQGDVEPEDL